MRYRVAAVDRALSILNVFDDHQPLTQAEIARATGLSEATALRYLATLARHRVVERDSGSGRYRLGLRLFQLGEHALVDRDPRQVALPFMEQLLARFDETVNLALRNADALVLIEALESGRSIKKGASVGDPDVWHASAVGKAILASLEEDEVRGLLKRVGAPRYTPKTFTSYKALAPELKRVRELGYAVDDEEGEEGLRCVGAPIFDRREGARYAISVSAPANRLPHDAIPEVGEQIKAAAAAVSARLGYAVLG